MQFGVLPVGGGARAAPDPAAAAAAAAAWWRHISNGHWHPQPVLLPAVTVAEDPARWCANGGVNPGPFNGAGLARAALLRLVERDPRNCPRCVVIVADVPIAPHAWRVAGGGVAVAPGRWVRRFAALPAGASLAAWVHELAHLLLAWPDLPESRCLMGSGAHRGGGRRPAPPAAWLRLGAGWMHEVPASATLTAANLAGDEVVSLQWRTRRLGLSRYDGMIVVDELRSGGRTLAAIPEPAGGGPLLAAVWDGGLAVIS